LRGEHYVCRRSLGSLLSPGRYFQYRTLEC
jgi:hypothetical protein